MPRGPVVRRPAWLAMSAVPSPTRFSVRESPDVVFRLIYEYLWRQRLRRADGCGAREMWLEPKICSLVFELASRWCAIRRAVNRLYLEHPDMHANGHN